MKTLQHKEMHQTEKSSKLSKYLAMSILPISHCCINLKPERVSLRSFKVFSKSKKM